MLPESPYPGDQWIGRRENQEKASISRVMQTMGLFCFSFPFNQSNDTLPADSTDIKDGFEMHKMNKKTMVFSNLWGVSVLSFPSIQGDMSFFHNPRWSLGLFSFLLGEAEWQQLMAACQRGLAKAGTGGGRGDGPRFMGTSTQKMDRNGYQMI